MVIYNPDPDFLGKLLKRMVMAQCFSQHKEKLHITEWEYGEPVEMISTDYKTYVQYSEGAIFEYRYVDDGPEKMTIKNVTF